MDGISAFLTGAAAQDEVLNPAKAVALLIYLVAGGLCSLWVRWLYRRYGTAISNREGMSSIFPLLTLTVIVVIFVVKSSLALSLGLVGALSIVRFRAAIKEPEELVYLFFCIALGLALGAAQPLVAVTGLVGFTLFVFLRHRRRVASAAHLLLTVSGPADDLLDGKGAASALLQETIGPHRVQRFDLEDGHAQLRVVVSPAASESVLALTQALRTRMPRCQVSFVNLDSLL